MPKCTALYQLENCTRVVGGKTVPTYAQIIIGRRGQCEEVLAIKAVLRSGKICFYPHKVYCFNSIIGQVENFLKRPGLPEMCEQWRERTVDENILADVYDG